ncbi:MAG: hypothetical protein ACUVUC_11385 [Thermoguttaceae bacterium]
MKLKVKLDPNSLQQSLLEHGEKLIFGIVVVCFLVFVYRAIGRTRSDVVPPDSLAAEAAKAKQHVLNSEPKAPEIKDYGQKAAEIRKQIDPAPYATKYKWEPQLFDKPKPRPTPKLFPLKKLMVTAGNGAFNVIDETQPGLAGFEGRGGAVTKGFRWVVITGLFDWKTQVRAYETAFRDTLPLERRRDIPQYTYFRVERAEVNPRDPSAPPTWTPIDVRKMFRLTYQWAAYGGAGQFGGDEVVDPFYIPPAPSDRIAFVFPLGPLVNRPWGPECGHPDIPLRRFESTLEPYGERGPFGERRPEAGKAKPQQPKEAGAGKGEQEKAPPAKPPRPEPQIEEPDEPDPLLAPGTMAIGEMGMGPARPAGRMTMPGLSPRTMPGYPTAMPGLTGMPAGYRPPLRRPSDEEAYDEEGYRVRTPMGPWAGDVYAQMPEQIPDYLLFRFFDFTVEPGKHYQYRVKLLLANPNFGLPPWFLESEKLAEIMHLETPWSDPSPVASVPLDSRVLLAPSRPREASPSLLLVHFNETDGMEAFHEVPAARGQLLNYLDIEFKPEPGAGLPGMGPMPFMGGPGAITGLRGELQEKVRKVNYLTEAVLLDYVGGGGLPGKDRDLLEPRMILLADRDGNLIVREELEDLSEYHRLKPPEVTRGGMFPDNYDNYDMLSSPDTEMDIRQTRGRKTPQGPYPGMPMMPTMPGGPGGPRSGKGATSKPGRPRMPPTYPGMGPGMDLEDMYDQPKRGRRPARGS